MGENALMQASVTAIAAPELTDDQIASQLFAEQEQLLSLAQQMRGDNNEAPQTITDQVENNNKSMI